MKPVYLMDHPSEGDRIERKTDRKLTREQLLWAGIGPGLRALDLGCAAGTTCRIMSGLVNPGGEVFGVDVSGERLEQGSRHPDHDPSITYLLGDADAIPLPDDSIDLAWSRFLFEYLQEPASALSEMIRVTRPGGTVCVSDLDGNCIWHDPLPAELGTLIADALETLRGAFYPRAGIMLYRMFVEAGLPSPVVEVRPYHTICGRIDREKESHWITKLEGVAKTLAARGWTPEKCDRFQTCFLKHLRDEHTMTYSTLITVRSVVSK